MIIRVICFICVQKINMLSVTTEVDVHFYDVDAIKIVWHGNYVKYMENSREAFCKKYGIAYMDVYRLGYVTPIADLQIKYLGTVEFGEKLLVETRYIPSKAAKMMFEYTIYRVSDKSVVAKATTTQLFMTTEGEFEVSSPDFFREWKKKWNV